MLGNKAELALQFNLAICQYVAETIRPFAEQYVHKDGFVPETMSTSFVTRSIFEKVRSKFPDCIIKFASDNPRNPRNKATAEELKMIRYFNENPQVEDWTGQIELDGRQHQVHFHARRIEQSCLRCHGNPEDAPKSLLQRYGDKAGFYRTVGDVIALDTVAIPTEQYRSAAAKQGLANSMVLIVGLSLLLGAICWIFYRLVTRRLAIISKHFNDAVDQQDDSPVEPIECTGNDEISVLARSFNALADRLGRSYRYMEQRVEERTKELEVANTRLQTDIAERKQIDEKLKLTQFSVDQAAAGIFWISPKAEFLYVNDNVCETLGYDRAELLTMTVHDIDPNFPAEAWPEHWQQLKQNGTLKLESIHRCKDGAEFPVEIVLNYLKYNGKEYNCAFAQDITERKYAENRLKQAKKFADNARLEIEKANKQLKLSAENAKSLAQRAITADSAKSQFLANMSHEIRTPMNAIIGFSEVLAEENLSGEQQQYVSLICQSAEHLLQLINDILDFSKIEAGRLDVEMVDCSLKQLLAVVESSMRPAAKTKNLAFKVLQGNEVPKTMCSDPVRLKQCLINLINNAVKFTDQGHIHVNVYTRQVDDIPYICFDVEDTGIGIPSDRLNSIFEEFAQLESGTTRRFDGTGLGLAITKQLAHLLGGELTVTSEIGKGSVFSLVVPAGVDPTSHSIPDKCDSRSESEPTFDEDRTVFSGKILVAEDVKTNQVLIRLLLERFGLQVTIAQDGVEAVDQAINNTFDLIVMDMQMPNMNGYDATRSLREKGITTPIVALTAYAMKGDDKKCLEAGCDDYLCKPIVRERLLQVIRKYLPSDIQSCEDPNEFVESEAN